MANKKVMNDSEPPGSENPDGSSVSTYLRSHQSNFKSIRKRILGRFQTPLEKKLVCGCAFLMALVLAFLIALCVVATRERSTEGSPLSWDMSKECQTSTCQNAAQALMDSMDTSIDPCQDFYRYTCGGWIAKNPIPDDKGRYTTFDLRRDELSQKLAKVLKEATNHTTSVNNAALLFQGCVNEEKREAEGLGAIKEALIKFGGWPIADPQWTLSGYRWYERVAQITRETGLTAIIAVSVAPDVNKTSHNIIYMTHSPLGLGRNQLVNLTASPRNRFIVNAYKNFIVSTAKLMNPNSNETNLAREADDMITFESSLARLTKSAAEFRDAKTWYHKMEVNEVQKVTQANFRWTIFLNDIFKDFPRVMDGTEVILTDKDYMKNAIELVKKTSPRTVANYIGWMFLMRAGEHTTKAFRDNQFLFEQATTGVQKQKKLERTCTDVVIELLGFAVGRLYVDQYFKEEERKDADQLVEDIRTAYRLTIENSAWMDETTKDRAKDKLKLMINMMGYPQWIKDDAELNDYYRQVPKVEKDKYFVSLLNTRKDRVAFVLEKWNKPTNRSHEWITTPSVVNALYYPSANTITFPAGILNLPFYKYGRSPALNFGGIGTVIGHEMSHGFDDQGSQYDEEGNLVNWWSKETKDKFNEKADCFREQYSSYVEPTTNMNLNGNNSVGENIADNGGLRNTFIAYKMQVLLSDGEDSLKNQRLPGIVATPEQLFFIGYASTWCGSERKESLEITIQYDTHSPNEFRVVVPLSNTEAFAEAFNCPLGSRMNPERKCKMW